MAQAGSGGESSGNTGFNPFVSMNPASSSNPDAASSGAVPELEEYTGRYGRGIIDEEFLIRKAQAMEAEALQERAALSQREGRPEGDSSSFSLVPDTSSFSVVPDTSGDRSQILSRVSRASLRGEVATQEGSVGSRGAMFAPGAGLGDTGILLGPNAAEQALARREREQNESISLLNGLVETLDEENQRLKQERDMADAQRERELTALR
jgi:hypothetical protein